MLTRNANMGTGQGRGVWPVLGILLAAALVPTACVLWFMNAAMRNERLAVRQKLTDVYRQKVQTDQNEIAAFWSSRTRLPADRQPAELFAAIVRSGLADSAVIRDPQDRLLYPDSPSPQSEGGPVQSQSAQATTTRSVETGPLWEQAQDLEYAQSNPAQAASLYQQIAQTRAAPPPTRS